MTNLEIVKSTYEGESSEENGRNLERHLAPDSTWREAEGFPYAGFYRGFAEVAEKVFAKLAGEWIGYRFTPEGYVADGDKVVAYGTYQGTFKRTGKEMRARVAHLWKLKDGKIIAFEQFVDSVPVANALLDTPNP
ncbi:MAG: nuclear transport factor 2 family protein [Fibrobacteria bacterium]